MRPRRLRGRVGRGHFRDLAGAHGLAALDHTVYRADIGRTSWWGAVQVVILVVIVLVSVYKPWGKIKAVAAGMPANCRRDFIIPSPGGVR